MSVTHELKITFSQGRELASWEFDDKGTEKCCNVLPGDKINLTFDGPGHLAEGVLLCGQMQEGLSSSAFVEGNHINLKEHRTLTVAQQMGLWGFSIAFSARNVDATTSFYYVPDPEVDVGSKGD
ncbi:hypothetical protein [uncultured Massilia sp.]|uniref:hypothetical protein n=1 Tax=uncultured Massilia sp. TaxID=169973 RepID=UPI0025E2EC3A|nr:hypothetical protein [uncultured Massilia sp.]